MFTAKRTFSPKTASALTPLQVAKAYNFPQGVDVSKRTVAILELGGAFDIKDVLNYCKQFGFKPPQMSTYFVDGALESASDADGEVCLDIDVIAAVAQGCKIKVVFGPNTIQGFIDGLAKCVSLNPDAISISWGGPEDTWDAKSRAAMDSLFQEAEEKGINIFCASGDYGSKDGETFGNHTDFPASSPYVIGCGGTRLELDANGARAKETGWSTSFLNPSGGGGGISKAYPVTPNWQEGTPGKSAGRRVPDVAGNADPASGYVISVDGNIQQVGGTSAVAPLYAALQVILNAMSNAHVGNMHTKLYKADKTIFFDVTSGNNGGYSASEGFDCVTGLGVIDGSKFAQSLTKE